MRPTVSSPDDTTLEITDPIEKARFVLRTSESIEPTTSSTTVFDRPVETAVRIIVSTLQIPELASIYVHPNTGNITEFVPSDGAISVDGPAILEVNISQMKLYIRVDGPVSITSDNTSVHFDFESETAVTVGVRSFHERPAGTVTTTASPEGAMEALSYLGSALKTTTPEQSFPTLRGHPPLIEVGNAFDSPEGIEQSSSGVRIEVPAEYEYVYPVASLAYYLGAEVVPAGDPRLVTDAGLAYGLDGPQGYEETVGRVLRQVFFFDCITCTEGPFPFDLHERQAIESKVEFDFGALYDQPLAERLETYLSVPFETVKDHIPEWPLTVDVDPKIDSLEAIPFVTDELALVRTIDRGRDETEPPSEEEENTVNDFYRSEDDNEDLIERLGESRITPDPVDSSAHAWFGEGIPGGFETSEKLTIGALRRSLDIDPDPTIEIHVVCNDDQMREEGVVADYYQLVDLPQFDVSMHNDLTTTELRDLLAEPADFLHFVSHVNENGMQCSDGYLDVHDLDHVGVSAFALNACLSYEQGMALVKSGSIGGVITIDTVNNSAATRIGTSLARALAAGFPLRLALKIAKKSSYADAPWKVIGSGGISLCQFESGAPLYLQVSRLDSGRIQCKVFGYPTSSFGLGSAYAFHLDRFKQRYLVGGELDTLTLSESELDTLLTSALIPVESDSELVWSNEVSASDF